MKQKTVWITCGPPGSGKSTWCEKQVKENGGVHCSRDAIRFSLLEEGEPYFAHEAEVLRQWKTQIANAISNPEVEDVYVDATHLNEQARKIIIDTLPKGDYKTMFVFFETDLLVCLERNAAREGRSRVPDEIIRNMYLGYQKYTVYGDGYIVVKGE